MYVFLQKGDKKIIIRDLDAYKIAFHPNVGANYTVENSQFEEELTKLMKDGYQNVTSEHYAHFVKDGESEVIMIDESDYSMEFLIKTSNGQISSLPRKYWSDKYNDYLNAGYTDVSSMNDKVVNKKVIYAKPDDIKFPTLDKIPRVPYSSIDMADRILNEKGFGDPFVWSEWRKRK